MKLEVCEHVRTVIRAKPGTPLPRAKLEAIMLALEEGSAVELEHGKNRFAVSAEILAKAVVPIRENAPVAPAVAPPVEEEDLENVLPEA